MTIYYSYPFNFPQINFNDFLDCFVDLKKIEIMNVSSKAIINGKFCKASVYYYTGIFAKKWLHFEPDNKEYVFQIGEHENTHGHFINIDMTYFLKELGLNIPWQKEPDSSRKKVVHLPQIPYDKNSECWDILWGMIQGLRRYDQKSLASMEMHKWWHLEKMNWVGPFSIGHLVGLEQFQKYHQQPFLTFIPNRDGSKGINKVIFSDGNYAALMGCYSMIATHKGQYFGFDPEGSEPLVKPFVMDFWTCDGDRLVDNWCQIDMIDLWRNINKNFRTYIDTELKLVPNQTAKLSLE